VAHGSPVVSLAVCFLAVCNCGCSAIAAGCPQVGWWCRFGHDQQQHQMSKSLGCVICTVGTVSATGFVQANTGVTATSQQVANEGFAQTNIRQNISSIWTRTIHKLIKHMKARQSACHEISIRKYVSHWKMISTGISLGLTTGRTTAHSRSPASALAAMEL